jgi:Fur family peroxide stress response transcriptional regulator
MTTDQEEISQRLNIKGYRLTKQRLAVLKALQGTKGHPDANWIYEKVRKEIPHISLGTIYRTLGILKEVGLLRELDYGSSLSHYDANTGNHPHVVCTNCARIDDLPLSLPDKLEEQASRITDFTVTDHRLEFYGLCPDCRPG